MYFTASKTSKCTDGSRYNLYCNYVVLHVFQYTELAHAIKTSFSPPPEVVILDSITDTKGWMREQTPPLHDHLKAHQFKFQRSESSGDTRMFYKEWSTDPFWLPQNGLAILPTGNTVPKEQPLILKPCYDPDNLKQLESTLRKVGAYLSKAGASQWWKLWLEEAKKFVEHVEPQAADGETPYTCTLTYL